MWIILISITLLGGCSLETWIASYLPDPTPTPVIRQQMSPSGRYTAQLYLCCDIYSYISRFEIYDRETGITHAQNLSDVSGLNPIAGGITFDWTPSEHYLLIITNNRVTSHGCNELVVYTGDGSELVFTSANTTSVCRIHPDADTGLSVEKICPNDDIIYSGYRLTPSTGVVISLGSEETSAEC
jgi:hypothetical protein